MLPYQECHRRNCRFKQMNLWYYFWTTYQVTESTYGTHEDVEFKEISALGPFTVEVTLSGQRTQGLFAFNLGVYHDFLLFDQ